MATHFLLTSTLHETLSCPSISSGDFSIIELAVSALVGGGIGMIFVAFIFIFHPFLLDLVNRLRAVMTTQLSSSPTSRVGETHLHTQYASQVHNPRPPKEFVVVDGKRVPLRRK